jgi:hypothetical protein
MIGQGSPRSSRARQAGWLAWQCRAARLALWTLVLSGLPVAAIGAEPSMRLRMEWGGGSAQRWEGSVAVTDGVPSESTPLGIEADEPGSMWITGNRLDIQSRSARSYDGVDLTVSGPLAGTLEFKLGARGAEPALNLAVPLSQLAHEPYSAQIDQTGNRLLIRRAPGDGLRVKLSRDSVIYAPGEFADVEVIPHMLSTGAPTRVRLVSQLFAARTSRDPLWSNEREVDLTADGFATDKIVLPVRLPATEGVYDLKITVHRRALPNRLGWKQTVDERKVQLVVIGARRPLADGAAPLPAVAETLFELDPANPRWWERWNVPAIPGLSRGPLGNGDAAPWQHPLGQLIQLGPGAREPDTSWEAFPLPISKPGQPHIVEVEYPTDVPQTLGISIVEPNVAGKVAPIGLDSGVYLPDESAGSEPRLARHRLIFWPRTKTPLLVLTNQRHGSRSVFGKVRVIGPKASVAAPLGRDTSRAAYLPPAFATPPGGHRLLAGYFPENFSATEGLDEWSGRGLDDWVTFYEGASRLIEYLQHVGYNGLIITVLADGSTIYPSQLLEPTTRYDTGSFFISGQDPVRKDVLELLMRMFDREGLQLTPAVQFSAPLPALEALRREADRASVGIDLVGPQGKRWLDDHEPRKGLAPYYNPLDPRVQDAMLDVLRELTERYGRHPSFNALGVQLSVDGYAQLPGIDCGYDEATVDRFIDETGLTALQALPHAERVKQITGGQRAAWIEWRAQEIAKLHQRMQAEISKAKAGPARLYLLGAHLFERPEIEQALRPTLPRGAGAQQAMISLGVNPANYARTPQISLLRPNLSAPPGSLTGQAAMHELNQSAELDRALAADPTPGALFFHEPRQLRLPSFDAKSPFKGTTSLLVSQLSPAGSNNRQRLAHAIATLDAAALVDGGWLLTLGEEDSLSDLIAAYRELPAARFETLKGTTQPVTIRTHSTQQGTYIYLVNDSPWKARATIELQVPAKCRLDLLGKVRKLPKIQPTDAPQSWVVELEPYELLAGRFSAATVQLSNVRVTLPAEIENDLYVRIRDLGERVAALGQPPAVENAGFDAPPSQGAPMAGWELRDPRGATAVLDSQQKFAGAASLRLSSTQAASLASAPITTLHSGRLSVFVHLRVADPARQPPLRLAISGRWKGQDYYRFAPVGADTAAKPINTEWTQYLFQVRDLPAEDLTDLRVRFDLMGPGEVWIDNVELREFSDDDLRELKKMITVAGYTLESRQFGDCQQLLDGYWPRFLLANVPLTQGPVTPPSAGPKPTDTVPPVEVETKPGIFDRVRRSLPTLLR